MTLALNSGLTDAERIKRATALTIAEAERRRNGALHQSEGHQFEIARVHRGDHQEGADGPLAIATLGEGESEAPARPCPPGEPEESIAQPALKITISGPPGSGKSVIAHLIRHALGREGIAVEGPDGLRSCNWHRLVDRLVWRGLTIELLRDETGTLDAATSLVLLIGWGGIVCSALFIVGAIGEFVAGFFNHDKGN